MSGNEALQIGLYNQLFDELNPHEIGVFPFVPNSATYPFVALGEEYISDVSTKTKKRHEIIHTIHGFSQAKTKAEINQINQIAINALSKPFPLGSGFYVSSAKLDLLETYIDPDVNNLFHSIARFIFTISKG